MIRIPLLFILFLISMNSKASWFEHCLFYGTYTNASEGTSDHADWKEYGFTLKVEKAARLIDSYVSCDRHVGKEFSVVLKKRKNQSWPDMGSYVVVEYQLNEGRNGFEARYKLIDLGGWSVPANKSSKRT